MRRFISCSIAALTLAACFAMTSQTQAADDNYWNGYWHWYQNDYRPYFTYRYPPGYDQYNPGAQYTGQTFGRTYDMDLDRYHGGRYEGDYSSARRYDTGHYNAFNPRFRDASAWR